MPLLTRLFKGKGLFHWVRSKPGGSLSNVSISLLSIGPGTLVSKTTKITKNKVTMQTTDNVKLLMSVNFLEFFCFRSVGKTLLSTCSFTVFSVLPRFMVLIFLTAMIDSVTGVTKFFLLFSIYTWGGVSASVFPFISCVSTEFSMSLGFLTAPLIGGSLPPGGGIFCSSYSDIITF